MAPDPQRAYDGQTLPLVVGRTPLLPVETFRRVFEAADCLEALRDLLVHNQLARKAIYVASPALSDALDEWLRGAPLKNPNAPLRALAYVSRMTFRCTPFGLCAGVGHVDLGSSATLRADTNQLGGPVAPFQATEAFRTLRSRAKVNATLHDLRHTAASWMLTAGVDVASVARILGYTTPTTTLGIYAHVPPASESRAVATIDERLKIAKLA